MNRKASTSNRAGLIGDIVGSRKAADRQRLHQRLTEVLAEIEEQVPALDPLVMRAGDEFQFSYRTVGEALHAGFLIRVALAPTVDVRFGVGWGPVELLDADTGMQDGPAWWQARTAIETVEARARHAGTKHARFCFRGGPDGDGPSEPAVDAALMCRDQLMGSLSTRSIRILGGLVAGQSKAEIARAEDISPSAVSQRAQRDGLDVIVAASAMLREIA